MIVGKEHMLMIIKFMLNKDEYYVNKFDENFMESYTKNPNCIKNLIS